MNTSFVLKVPSEVFDKIEELLHAQHGLHPSVNLPTDVLLEMNNIVIAKEGALIGPYLYSIDPILGDANTFCMS